MGGMPYIATLVLVATLALANPASGAAWSDKNERAPGEEASGRVCFVGATAPWFFGAYQEQTLGLSAEFAARGYETLWMNRLQKTRLPQGEYGDWRAVMKEMNMTNSIRPPTEEEQAKMGHLTFLGFPNIESPGKPGLNSNGFSVRQLNEAANMYNLDAIILLMDIGHLYLDGHHFDVPVILWMPYHFEQVNHQRAVLSTFSAIAALSDTATRVVSSVQSLTRTIPHSIDRANLNALADESEYDASFRLRASDSKGCSLRRALFNSTMHDRMFRRDIDEIDEDTFLVLMQGGNYEVGDRKGWVASINAFAQFQRANPKIKTHLWIHTVDSTMVGRDHRYGESTISAPRHGISLRLTLQQAGIPSSMYTLDENYHDKALTMALKRNADVCLHTSKSEGFGLVVIECQALGTPVVTTNYTAMRDYTKYGIAVEPAGLEAFQGAYFALPSVAGAAKALEAVLMGTTKFPSLDSVFKWIDTDLSIDKVASEFEALLAEAETAQVKKPKRWTISDRFQSRPIFTVVTDEQPMVADWDTPWTMYHHPDIVVDYDLTQMHLIHATATAFYGLLYIAPTRNGTPVEVMPEEGSPHMLNTDLVILVPTWIMREFQEGQSYIWDLIYSVAGSIGSQKDITQLPSPLAKLPDVGGRASGEQQMKEL